MWTAVLQQSQPQQELLETAPANLPTLLSLALPRMLEHLLIALQVGSDKRQIECLKYTYFRALSTGPVQGTVCRMD